MSDHVRPSFREWLDLLAYDDPLGWLAEAIRADRCPGAGARLTYYQLRRHVRNHHAEEAAVVPVLPALTDALDRFKVFKEMQHIIASGRGWLLASDTPEMVEVSQWLSKAVREELRGVPPKTTPQAAEGHSS